MIRLVSCFLLLMISIISYNSLAQNNQPKDPKNGTMVVRKNKKTEVIREEVLKGKLKF